MIVMTPIRLQNDFDLSYMLRCLHTAKNKLQTFKNVLILDYRDQTLKEIYHRGRVRQYMMVKSEGVANNYTKYIHFIHPLDTTDGNTYPRPTSCGTTLPLNPFSHARLSVGYDGARPAAEDVSC